MRNKPEVLYQSSTFEYYGPVIRNNYTSLLPLPTPTPPPPSPTPWTPAPLGLPFRLPDQLSIKTGASNYLSADPFQPFSLVHKYNSPG